MRDISLWVNEATGEKAGLICLRHLSWRPGCFRLCRGNCVQYYQPDPMLVKSNWPLFICDRARALVNEFDKLCQISELAATFWSNGYCFGLFSTSDRHFGSPEGASLKAFFSRKGIRSSQVPLTFPLVLGFVGNSFAGQKINKSNKILTNT